MGQALRDAACLATAVIRERGFDEVLPTADSDWTSNLSCAKCGFNTTGHHQLMRRGNEITQQVCLSTCSNRTTDGGRPPRRRSTSRYDASRHSTRFRPLALAR
jgi:hypothetical protein